MGDCRTAVSVHLSLAESTGIQARPGLLPWSRPVFPDLPVATAEFASRWVVSAREGEGEDGGLGSGVWVAVARVKWPERAMRTQEAVVRPGGRDGVRFYFPVERGWLEGSAEPRPSTKVTNRSAGPAGNCSRRPLGQRTWMLSMEAAEPSPKWRRGSLVER